MPPADSPIHETAFHVRYAETDRMGIVHHAAYLIWFEEGRSAFIRQRGWSYAAIEESGYYLAAGELQAKYIRPAHYDQQIIVRCWIDHYQSRAVTFACEALEARHRQVLFRASIKLICLNRHGQITRIPAAWSAWLDS